MGQDQGKDVTLGNVKASLVQFSYLTFARKAKGGNDLLRLWKNAQYQLRHWEHLKLAKEHEEELRETAWQVWKDRRIEFYKHHRKAPKDQQPLL